MREKSIMLFDLYAGGHHGQHIQQLISYWGRHNLSGRLNVVVPAQFSEIHEALVPLLDQYSSCGINLVPITEEPRLDSGNRFGLLHAHLEHGRLLKRYIDTLRPDHCMVMYFDHVQFSLATGLRFDFSVRISGTYFRPSFHYASVSAGHPDFRQRILDLRKRLLLRAAIRNPHFDTLFCLDPFVIPYVRMPRPGTQAVALPDGIDLSDPLTPSDSIRRHLGVEPGRKLFLLFGSLARRKGLHQTLDALMRLPDSLARTVCLALVGSVVESDREPLRERISNVMSQRPVQIVLHDDFVPDAAVQSYFHAADLALVPYQRHIGSSGVLVRAAQAEIPVLGSDYGMMGLLIRTRELGCAVDTTSPEAIAAALQHFLSGPGDAPFDRLKARQFAAENTADAMSATIFRHLGVQEEIYA